MKSKITSRDQELLSSYIDNELKAKDRRRLEQRLAADPALQTAMDSLQQTRQLIKSLPSQPAPRSFSLTPEMVGGRASRPALYPVLQFASALAGILFVVAVLGDVFLGPGSFASAPISLSQAPESEFAEDIVEQEIEAPPTPTGELLTPIGGTPQGTPGAETFDSAPAEPAVESAEGQARVLEMEEMVESTGVPLGLAPSQKVATGMPADSGQGDAEYYSNDGPGLTPEPDLYTAPTPTVAPTIVAPEVPPRGLPLLRIVEIVLGLIALLSGFGAIYLRTTANN